jgi:large subunit ribosomal protein L13
MTNDKIVIDAEGEIFGRLCSFAAKQALEGHDIIILNCEKSIISGTKNDILKKFREDRARGGRSLKGPHHSKIIHFIMKKSIRGMLPDFRWGEGKAAFTRIKCHEGIPTEFAKEKPIKLNTNKPNRYIQLKEVADALI